MPRYLIIGGVAGGMSAATRLRRLDESAEIIVFEKGDYISYENASLPYFVGGLVRERKQLWIRTPESCRRELNVDIRTHHEVMTINREQKNIHVTNLKSGESTTESYDKLILAPGSKTFEPPIPGIDLHSVYPIHDIPDTERIKSTIEQNGIRHVTLVGGGYIGIELADNLSQIGLEVAVVDVVNHIIAVLDPEMAALVQDHLYNKGVRFHLGSAVESFANHNNGVKVTLTNGESIDTEMAILSMGIRPNIDLAKAARLKIGKRNGIVVNSYLQTSDPDIYAVGDVIEVKHPVTNTQQPIALAGPANKQGRLAADNIVLGNTKGYPGTLGTSIAKVGDLSVAATGASEAMLLAAKMPYQTTLIHPTPHAAYFPSAWPLSIKLLFGPRSGKLYGAQVIGQDGVLKSIDLLSFAIQNEQTIYDLTRIEHAYAPAYSWEKDPVNLAGFAAENLLTGLVQQVLWSDVQRLIADRKTILLDVRSTADFKKGHIKGAVNIPLPKLRREMALLSDKKQVVVYSESGQRAYSAARILEQHKRFLAVFQLSGGYRTYATAVRQISLKR